MTPVERRFIFMTKVRCYMTYAFLAGMLFGLVGLFFNRVAGSMVIIVMIVAWSFSKMLDDATDAFLVLRAVKNTEEKDRNENK